MSVGMPETLKLEEFGQLLFDIFGDMAYHVGSSLEKKTGWRDVDIRLIMDDEKYEKMRFGKPSEEHGNDKWRRVCLNLSMLGKQITGLPIDFQIQQRTIANERFNRKKGCRRSALFINK